MNKYLIAGIVLVAIALTPLIIAMIVDIGFLGALSVLTIVGSALGGGVLIAVGIDKKWG